MFLLSCIPVHRRLTLPFLLDINILVLVYLILLLSMKVALTCRLRNVYIIKNENEV